MIAGIVQVNVQLPNRRYSMNPAYIGLNGTAAMVYIAQ